MAQQTELLFSCGLTSMLPRSTDQEKAAITAPVFLGFGEDDLRAGLHGLRRALHGSQRHLPLRSSRCGPLPQPVCVRTTLWDRLAHWAQGYGGTSDNETLSALAEYRTHGG